MPYEPPPYSISHMTGCAEGRVPAISLPEALESGEKVKVVDIQRLYPIYGTVVGINFAMKMFDLDRGYSQNEIITLSMKDYAVFEIQSLYPAIPINMGSSIICDGEIFTVVDETITTVWVGDHNLVYYSEDIQALAKRYDYAILMS